MEQTRIVLVDLPRMLHEIIRTTIEEQPDMVVLEVPAWSGDDAGLEEIDVVVSGGDGHVARPLVQRRARVRFFALSASGKENLLYELLPHRVALGEVSPAQLVAAIRGWCQARGPADTWTKTIDQSGFPTLEWGCESDDATQTCRNITPNNQNCWASDDHFGFYRHCDREPCPADTYNVDNFEQQPSCSAVARTMP